MLLCSVFYYKIILNILLSMFSKKLSENFIRKFGFRILKILLRDLIEKSIQQDRNNSKILLRSNASIAEKMLSNWFAFLLFGYIKVRKSILIFLFFHFHIKRNVLVLHFIYYFNQLNNRFKKDRLIVLQMNQDIR